MIKGEAIIEIGVSTIFPGDADRVLWFTQGFCNNLRETFKSEVAMTISYREARQIKEEIKDEGV